jgi:hypothetical protein
LGVEKGRDNFLVIHVSFGDLSGKTVIKHLWFGLLLKSRQRFTYALASQELIKRIGTSYAEGYGTNLPKLSLSQPFEGMGGKVKQLSVIK